MGRLGDDRLRGRRERPDPRRRLRATSRPHKPFWIHGSEGTIRGSGARLGPTPGSEWLELEREGGTTRFELDGSWHTNGFAGALGELVTAIAEGREPYNSARHNLLSLELTLAACRSADDDGRPVVIGALRHPRDAIGRHHRRNVHGRRAIHGGSVRHRLRHDRAPGHRRSPLPGDGGHLLPEDLLRLGEAVEVVWGQDEPMPVDAFGRRCPTLSRS